ncbi:MAG: STAS domain-containing protein [Planctomycetota bacterium]
MNQDGVELEPVVIIGDLTADLIAGWSERLAAAVNEHARVGHEVVVFDLARAGRIDSQGVALLIDMKRRCNAHDQELVLRRCPAQIMAVLQAVRLVDFFGLVR